MGFYVMIDKTVLRGYTMKDRDSWETPQQLFNILYKQYLFDIDCCATKDNKKCSDYTNNFLRFRATSLFKCAWMNPPFSKARAMFENFFKSMKSGVAIYRCDNMETQVWQNIILKKATWIFIPNKRIAYEGQDGNGARFPSALIGFNVEEPELMEGTIIYPLNTPKHSKRKE